MWLKFWLKIVIVMGPYYIKQKNIFILNHICLDLLTLLASPTLFICFNMRQGGSTDFSM